MGDLLQQYLHENATGDLVPWKCQVECADRFSLTVADVEGLILDAGLLPARYQRNRNTFSIEQQCKLFHSCVAVIGCGGLGGHIIELLARLGVGKIIAVDPDIFEEHNLNRQILSSIDFLGWSKVALAATRVADINPATTLIPIKAKLTAENGVELLQHADLATDALDSVTSRLELAKICEERKIPLVHGAIAGWYGQVLTQYPGEMTLQRLYEKRSQSIGAEKKLGNPAFTPAVIAGIEVAEICRVMMGDGQGLKGRMISVNLLDMELEKIEL